MQQEAISSFKELPEKKISQNSQCARSLMDQCSGVLRKYIQEQVEDLNRK